MRARSSWLNSVGTEAGYTHSDDTWTNPSIDSHGGAPSAYPPDAHRPSIPTASE
jgi:hypothetical protein